MVRGGRGVLSCVGVEWKEWLGAGEASLFMFGVEGKEGGLMAFGFWLE